MRLGEYNYDMRQSFSPSFMRIGQKLLIINGQLLDVSRFFCSNFKYQILCEQPLKLFSNDFNTSNDQIINLNICYTLKISCKRSLIFHPKTQEAYLYATTGQQKLLKTGWTTPSLWLKIFLSCTFVSPACFYSFLKTLGGQMPTDPIKIRDPCTKVRYTVTEILVNTPSTYS